jgi:hypothetical protein
MHGIILMSESRVNGFTGSTAAEVHPHPFDLTAWKSPGTSLESPLLHRGEEGITPMKGPLTSLYPSPENADFSGDPHGRPPEEKRCRCDITRFSHKTEDNESFGLYIPYIFRACIFFIFEAIKERLRGSVDRLKLYFPLRWHFSLQNTPLQVSEGKGMEWIEGNVLKFE